ncbi:YqkE family protein [Effusibacillus lacus]|uniref:DUF3886 domain-containing protein n=1 Tax=Effusibacillus lacus TaxID=1348429 RepID=A0A292YMU4_9BACL|nr:YqkE family protein [Effusibacillus lacus]TCS72297.1 uncharacterized protein DUF3886 [Effusibacillus lacus]GAX90231.1 hypothetical protein EFBL_1857 [Effusibacillus lacus]
MAKKKRPTGGQFQQGAASGNKSYSAEVQAKEKPATLKDLLNPDVLAKLKTRQAEMEAEEARKREEKRRQEEEARKAEQKRLENDFEYLLNNSKQDWRKFKE